MIALAEVLDFLRRHHAKVIGGRITGFPARLLTREMSEAITERRAEVVEILQAGNGYDPVCPEAWSAVDSMLRGQRPLDILPNEFQNRFRPSLLKHIERLDDGLRKAAALKLLKMLDDLHGSGQVLGHPFHTSYQTDPRCPSALQPLLRAHLDGYDVNVDRETYELTRRGQLNAIIAAGIAPWAKAASEVMHKLDQRYGIKG